MIKKIKDYWIEAKIITDDTNPKTLIIFFLILGFAIISSVIFWIMERKEKKIVS